MCVCVGYTVVWEAVCLDVGVFVCLCIYAGGGVYWEGLVVSYC